MYIMACIYLIPYVVERIYTKFHSDILLNFKKPESKYFKHFRKRKTFVFIGSRSLRIAREKFSKKGTTFAKRVLN